MDSVFTFFWNTFNIGGVQSIFVQLAGLIAGWFEYVTGGEMFSGWYKWAMQNILGWLVDPVRMAGLVRGLVGWFDTEFLVYVMPVPVHAAFVGFFEFLSSVPFSRFARVGLWLADQFVDASILLSVLGLSISMMVVAMMIRTAIWIWCHVPVFGGNNG